MSHFSKRYENTPFPIERHNYLLKISNIALELSVILLTLDKLLLNWVDQTNELG